MNNSMTFEEQTEQIVEALFTTLCLREPWEKVTDRCLDLHSLKEVQEQGKCVLKFLDDVNSHVGANIFSMVLFASLPRMIIDCAIWEKLDLYSSGSASSFDPVGIATCLRSLGDQFNAEIEGQVQAVIAEESRKKIKKFREVVESLSRNWSSQTPELEPERAFLAVAVKLFVKFINKTHGDKGQINILTETINGNPEVRGYIERQGGWGNLKVV